MFFNNSDNDPYGDLRKKEEYERQQQANFTRGIGHFLYRYFVYSMIWFFSSVLFSMILNFVLGWHIAFTTVIGMIGGLILFKVPYVKQEPIRSLLTIGFVFGLMFVTFSEIS